MANREGPLAWDVMGGVTQFRRSGGLRKDMEFRFLLVCHEHSRPSS